MSHARLRQLTSRRVGGVQRARDSGARLIALTRKEIRQLLRDPSSLAIGIGLPIVLILIFGYGLSLDVTNAPVAVVLEDPSPTGCRGGRRACSSPPYISPVDGKLDA